MEKTSATAELENLKKTLDELRLRKMSDEREKAKLEGEISELRKIIEDRFGISVDDFDKTISELKEQIALKTSALKKKLQEAQSRMGE